ncbi:MAG TPA: c-type cytochrome [Terracidiphilus sp.]|nr:c-type cytochrome [Terracidiphilus sp.]HUX28928.1 c-type cytochrome [Terracidiphilus sp.]
MNKLTDLLLSQPLPDAAGQALLFATFFIHFILALTMIGTAVIAYHSLLARRLRGTAGTPSMAGRLLRDFLPLEALVVVWGVAPLLLIQANHTVSFFTAAMIASRYWVLLIVLLVMALFTLDLLAHIFAHREGAPAVGHIVLATAGLTALLAIPGIFCAVLTISENPQFWPTLVRAHNHLDKTLGWYWLARYLHVLGASLVVGAAFHYLRSAQDDGERRRHMLRWIVGGLAYQFVVGLMLLKSIPAPLGGITIAMIALGAAAVLGTFIATLMGVSRPAGGPKEWVLAGLVFAILLPMLLARQSIQDRAYFAVRAIAKRNADEYRSLLRPFQGPALAAYEQKLQTPLQSGEALYNSSCAFCHGTAADGHGPSATELAVPPESLRDVRTTRLVYTRLVRSGVPNTGMSAFSFYSPQQLDAIADYLYRKYQMLGTPPAIPVSITAESEREAAAVWANTCATCHGNGHPTRLGAAFQPQTPDLTVYGMTPKRSFDVITNGYPGTMMRSFGKLPEGTRWGLVKLVSSFRSSHP